MRTKHANMPVTRTAGGQCEGDAGVYMAISDFDSEFDLTEVGPLPRPAPMPHGCAPLMRIMRAVPCPLDGSMAAAALLMTLRGVARSGGVSGAQSRHIAFAV